ncbi:Hypothetical protein R9X50_00777600 [Acrodontium crateriforme]|uniref:Tho complex subunit 7 n=1 Tax=Acrodontium crateriforme TaxID=150365 RepID=A0AAQ3MAQ1_9PEZI|nr:Hypothetical protein R9X50_00777600 [Acrodontium crateriforme]
MATQSSHVYGFLPEQSQEDALHASRLLQVEERPFARVTKALLGKESLLRQSPKQLPSPPPEGEESESKGNASHEDGAFIRQKFREDILLDFAALESSILRIQLIQQSNERERERYAAEKAKILETSQAVRDNTVELHAHLAEAARVRELRKGYDELASKILNDRNLKSRDDSLAEIEKLEKEIEDLQQESGEFEGTWINRREQFDRVVEEGRLMMNLIKGIKDDPEGDTEADKDENMEDDDDDGKAETSATGTPANGGRTPAREIESETPLPESGDNEGTTPIRPTNRFLDVEDATRSNSRAASPSMSQSDVKMSESTQDATPRLLEAMEGIDDAAETTDVNDTMDES